MDLNHLGKILTTNKVRIGQEVVEKRYSDLSPGFLINLLRAKQERKLVKFAHQRFERETRLIPLLYNAGLNTPNLIDSDGDNKTITIEKYDLVDFIDTFENQEIEYNQKLELLYDAFELVSGIHGLGTYHGDTYLKNFFRRSDSDRGPVYSCDFEFERLTPESVDLMILAANSTQILKNFSRHAFSDITYQCMAPIFGRSTSFLFEERDMGFYNKRFGMGKEFFDYFSSSRHYV